MATTYPEDFGIRSSVTTEEIENQNDRKKFIETLNPNIIAEAPFLFADRRLLTGVLSKIKLFELVNEVPGAIIECGVHQGNSFGLWCSLSSILEPTAFTRIVIGFDTFTGFPSISNQDSSDVNIGQLSNTNLEVIQKCIKIQDKNRPIGHVPKA